MSKVTHKVIIQVDFFAEAAAVGLREV